MMANGADNSLCSRPEVVAHYKHVCALVAFLQNPTVDTLHAVLPDPTAYWAVHCVTRIATAFELEWPDLVRLHCTGTPASPTRSIFLQCFPTRETRSCVVVRSTHGCLGSADSL